MKKVAAVLISVLLAACSSTPKNTATLTDTPARTTAAPVSQTDTTPTAPTPSHSVTAPPAPSTSPSDTSFAEQAKTLAGRSVYFDFDQSQVKPEYLDVIKQQAGFVIANPNDVVTLEGNADERGSNEYNLALGDRRANAVRKNMELSGVATSKIRVVSFGEEKPRYICHEENCWQENRRVDFVHQLK